MNIRTLLLAGAAALLVSTTSFASPIAMGSAIDITGTDRATNNTSIDLATGLTFKNVSLGNDPTTMTGSFAGLFIAGQTGTIKDIASFSNFTPITTFYSFTSGDSTVTFDLLTLSDPTRIASVDGSIPSLSISGTGLFHLTGYDVTAANFTLTTQGSQVTTFSASTEAVPEPASLAVLGVGLLGIGLIRRRRRA